MPKYTVRGPIHGSNDDYYVMDDGEECVYFDWQAQAEICAFALNAIAEGRILTKLMPPNECPNGPHYAGFYCRDYNGPTEGVA